MPRTAGDEQVLVVDADTHFSEPHDLWTSRVPAKYKNLVPHVVKDGDGNDTWLVNGDDVLQKRASASSVIRKDGTKLAFWDWDIRAGGMKFEDVADACWDVASRLRFMDEQGVAAQIMYPNLTGFSAHRLAKLEPSLSRVIVTTYNDAMGEIQESSGQRIFPQALVPFWDIDFSVEEVERVSRDLGLRGITMSSEPHAGGLLPITDHHWDPLWEACSALKLPINFHVGASEFGEEAFFKGAWPGLDRKRRFVIGCVQLEMHNARVLTNLLASDLLSRHPDTKWVSVESGIGWIPYVIERLEHQLLEQSLSGDGLDQPSPRELFRRQVYGCFWFEEAAPSKYLDEIGFDNVLFETDFPHTTCLYPNGVEHGMRVLAPWGAEVQRKVMGGNAIQLYNLPL
ncbi:MAG: amidohydrolase family protein [Acidimicrobiia bacterium]